MQVFELFGKVALDGADKVKEGLSGIEAHSEQVSKGLKIAGAALTALGVAGLAMVSSARNLNAQLGQTAITVGVSTKEMRDLALSVTDVTFRLSSVAATFEVLARAGMRNKEEMAKAALAFDTLADATGSSAEALADTLIPAFKNFGLEIPTTVEELDKFTWLTKNTIIDLAEFGSMMSYVAQYGSELDLSLEEMIGTLAALDAQGKSSSTITKMFRTAVTQAASGAATFTDALGLTQEEIDGYIGEMRGATGITEEYKKASDEQYGIMEKVKAKFEELTLVAGSFLTPMEPILALMTALGPMMLIISMHTVVLTAAWWKATGAKVAHTAALVAHKVALLASAIAIKAVTAAQWLWNVAMTANPIGLIIAAVALLAAGVYALWKNWDKIVSFFKGEASRAISQLDQALQRLAESVGKNFEDMLSDVETATQRAINSATSVADAEKSALDKRAALYGDFQEKRLDQIDEMMMAEIAAVDPSVAAWLEGYNDEITALDEREAARKEADDKAYRRSLKKQLNDDDLSRAEREKLERELEAFDDTKTKERLIEERNRALSGLDMEGYFEGQKSLIDQQLENQISAYNSDLEAFQQLNAEKLEDAVNFVNEYNRIMESMGAEKKYEYEVPTEGTLYPPYAPGAGGSLGNIAQQGSLPGLAGGGLITEPTLLYGLRSQRPYAVAGEAGAEAIGKVGDTYYNYNVSFPNAVVRDEMDITKISQQVARELNRLKLLRGNIA